MLVTSPVILCLICVSVPSDGSYQEITIIATHVNDWKQHNDSHLSMQEANLTYSSANGTWLPPADSFDPLGGHTVWQVNGYSSFFSFAYNMYPRSLLINFRV